MCGRSRGRPDVVESPKRAGGASAGGDRENKVCTVQEKKKESGKKRGELNETEKKGGVRIGKMNDALFPDKFCRKGVQKGR